MGNIINRRRFCGGEKLPQGAVRIEYLESDGGQYIKTDIVGEPSIDLYMDYQLVSGIDEDRKLIGNNASVGLATIDNKWRIAGDGFNTTSFYTDTNRHIFRTEGDDFYIDNTIIYNKKRERITDYLLYIFAMSNKYGRPDGKCAIMKIYECKIFDDDTLVRHLIPVRIGTTGYMYDKVSKQLFGNAGTGSFILGPDKGSVTTITQQQQQEMYG